MRCASLCLLSMVATVASAAEPHRVYVGAYLTDVSDFDLKAGRFKADVRVWLKWLGDDTVPGLTFENAELDSKDELGRESDGRWHSVQWRVQGTFRGDFPVYTFPFDRQTLPVVFGLDERDGVLVPDLAASGMSPRFSVTGWNYEPSFNARTEETTYASDLGSVTNEGRSATRRRVSFTVELERPVGPYLVKFALPLALILLISLLALLLPSKELEVRSAMGVTALLSCIAFHYTQADTLPDVTYLVAADKLFLGAYVLVTLTLVVSVATFRAAETHPTRARRIDRLSLAALPLASVGGVAVLMVGVMSRPAPRPQPHPEVLATQPVLKLGVPALESPTGSGLPSRRGALVKKSAQGAWVSATVEEAPSMTSALVRLLPEGGMRVRWHLLEGARWSDGTPLDANDLSFSFTTVANPFRTNLERVDERTVEVTYSVRRSAWLAGVPLYSKRVAEPLYADGGRDVMARATNQVRMPTAGPYVLEEFTPGARAVLRRNEHSAGPRPVFDRIEAMVVADPVKAAEALLRHEVDVLPNITGATVEALRGHDEVRVLEQPGELLYVLAPNVTRPPWSDPKARRALLEALDRPAMAKALAPSPAQVVNAWRATFHGTLPGSAPSFSELGFAGQTVTLHVGPRKSATAPNAVLAERVSADLTRAGLTVEIVEHAELNSFLQKREYDGLVLTGRDTDEPDRFLNVPFTDGHYAVEQTDGAHYDAQMLEVYERYASSLYVERRAVLEETLQARWLERLPMIPLVLTSRLAAVRADLIGPEWGEADSLWWNLAQWHFAPERR